MRSWLALGITAGSESLVPVVSAAQANRPPSHPPNQRPRVPPSLIGNLGMVASSPSLRLASPWRAVVPIGRRLRPPPLPQWLLGRPLLTNAHRSVWNSYSFVQDSLISRWSSRLTQSRVICLARCQKPVILLLGVA